MPSSSLDLTGIASYELFLRGTLDVIGAYPDLHHVGQYKTAVNTFTERNFTQAHREMAVSLNRDLFDQIVGGIAQGRNKTESGRARAHRSGAVPGRGCVTGQPLDGLAYEDEVRNQLRAEAGTMEDTEIDGEDYAGVSPESLGLDSGPRVAVIRHWHDHQRAERLRSRQWSNRRFRHTERVHPRHPAR